MCLCRDTSVCVSAVAEGEGGRTTQQSVPLCVQHKRVGGRRVLTETGDKTREDPDTRELWWSPTGRARCHPQKSGGGTLGHNIPGWCPAPCSRQTHKAHRWHTSSPVTFCPPLTSCRSQCSCSFRPGGASPMSPLWRVRLVLGASDERPRLAADPLTYIMCIHTYAHTDTGEPLPWAAGVGGAQAIPQD